MSRKFQIDSAIMADIQTANADSYIDNLKMLDIELIEPNEGNFYELSEIETLAEDIERQGLMTALVVSEHGGRYKLISGHRRLSAVMVTMAMMSTITAFAEGDTPVVDGEAAFNKVIGFFATWIGRIGLVVAFVGGIMFALAIKNDDAEAKTRGLMTLASGFVVFALTLYLDLFGITVGTV